MMIAVFQVYKFRSCCPQKGFTSSCCFLGKIQLQYKPPKWEFVIECTTFLHNTVAVLCSDLYHNRNAINAMSVTLPLKRYNYFLCIWIYCSIKIVLSCNYCVIFFYTQTPFWVHFFTLQLLLNRIFKIVSAILLRYYCCGNIVAVIC